MADEFSLSIDTDWKKQAQEEKRKLAEEQQKKAAAAAATTPPGSPSAAAGGSGPARGVRRELPPASFSTLVQSIMTQALFHLGELAVDGAEGGINLDRAKHQVDTLGVLESKTVNNLSTDEQLFLDTALYEVRSRYIHVASRYI
jgi:hypothetical protein